VDSNLGYFVLHVLYEIEKSGKEIARSPLKVQLKVQSAKSDNTDENNSKKILTVGAISIN